MTMNEANKFMVTLSVDISDGRNRLAALKQQAMSTCVNKKWAGLVELMALASVIKKQFFQFTLMPLHPSDHYSTEKFYQGRNKMGLAAKTATLCGHVAVRSTQSGFFNPIIS